MTFQGGFIVKKGVADLTAGEVLGAGRVEGRGLGVEGGEGGGPRPLADRVADVVSGGRRFFVFVPAVLLDVTSGGEDLATVRARQVQTVSTVFANAL